MKVGVIQSSFIPWRGYFDFINSVETFIFLDDVQFTKRDWRSRNKIKTKNGASWLTVPVEYHTRGQLIRDTKVDSSQDWITIHRNKWYENYKGAPYIDDLLDIYNIVENKYSTISQLNIELIRSICEYLNIKTQLLNSNDIKVGGSKTEKLINLLQSVGGREYVSGSNADNYLDKEAFIKAGIALEYKSYEYPAYPQLWGEFDGAVTILDIIANCGPDAKNYIHSSSPNQIIIR